MTGKRWSLQPKPAASGEFVSVAGRRIHYVERGEGPPVLFLHGMPGTCLDFEHVLPRLSGARSIAIDRPGYGWSEGGPLPYKQQIAMVRELLSVLEIERAVLVGHSFGGLLALGVAHTYPEVVASMVLVAPSGGGVRSGPLRLGAAKLVKVMQRPGLRQLFAGPIGVSFRKASAEIDLRFAFGPDPVDPAYRDRLAEVTLHDDNLDAMAEDRLSYDADVRWIDRHVPTLGVPSALILAVGDRPIPIEHGRKLAAALPNPRVVELPGGHMIPYMHPDTVAGEVTRATEMLSDAAPL